MKLNQPSLIQFENERKLNGLIPPSESNSFYTIGNGTIDLYTKRDSINDYRFDISIESGEVYTGTGNFILSGDIVDPEKPYCDMKIKESSILVVNNIITLSNAKLDVYGSLKMLQYSQLILKDNSNVVLYSDSNLLINKDVKIIIESGSSLTIYGTVNIEISLVSSFINNKSITIDSAAVMNVNGLESLGNRLFSITDYEKLLRDRIINKYTQGENNYQGGRIGYTWTGGDPLRMSQIIKINLMNGSIPLGDFKLSVLGIPENDIDNLQIISDLHIMKNTTLYISEEYNEYKYIHPELYLGIIIGNNSKTADCVVDGTIIVDGINSLITLDRCSTMHISESGEVYLKNGSIIRSTYNDDKEILFIDGKLIIEDIMQIETFNKNNIVFGDNGKLIILNPDTGEKKLLFTTPNGIEDTLLYKLFKDRLEHVELHISNNIGIGIDQYYEFYSRDMKNWYNGMRIEKAIKEGLIIWHNGGFIELYHDITPWVTNECTLYHAARIFKTFGSYDSDKLQDAVNRLKYAGCGNILFRFIDDDNIKEITLVLDDINMESINNDPISKKYTLNTTNDGLLFIRNKVNNADQKTIINDKSRIIDIENKKAEFNL